MQMVRKIKIVQFFFRFTLMCKKKAKIIKFIYDKSCKNYKLLQIKNPIWRQHKIKCQIYYLFLFQSFVIFTRSIILIKFKTV